MNIAAAYHQLIDAIVATSRMPDSVLHMHVGMMLMLGTAVLSRRSLSSPVPLLLVVVMEAGNEVMDRLVFGSWRIADTSWDMFNTMMWPSAVFLYSRWRRSEARRRYRTAKLRTAEQLELRRAELQAYRARMDDDIGRKAA